jgi:hypothetical protein
MSRPQPDDHVDVVSHELGCPVSCHGNHGPDGHTAVHIAGQCDTQPADAPARTGRWSEVTCIVCRVSWRGHLARDGHTEGLW